METILAPANVEYDDLAPSTRSIEDENPFASMMASFDEAADKVGLDPDLYALLRKPDREITVSLPTQLDDGTLSIFEGYRVQHNAGLGPYFGPLRVHSGTMLDELRALAGWMTWKCALLERALRRLGRRHPHVGPAPLARRARTRRAALRLEPAGRHRLRARHLRRRPGHRRAGHGLGDGHRLDALAHDRERGRVRQAAQAGRHARPLRRDRAGPAHPARPGARALRPAAQRRARDHPGRRPPRRQPGAAAGGRRPRRAGHLRPARRDLQRQGPRRRGRRARAHRPQRPAQVQGRLRGAHQRGAARAQVRRLPALRRGQRGAPAQRALDLLQADRRGRARRRLAALGSHPGRTRHRGRARHPLHRRRHGRELLRVGPEPRRVLVAAGRGAAPPRALHARGLERGGRDRATSRTCACAWPRRWSQ